MRRGDMVGVAGQHDQLAVWDLLLPRARRVHRGEAAFLGGDDEGWAGDLRQVSADVGAGDRAHKAELGRGGGAAHELAPELETLRREGAAEAIAHVLPGPVL